MEYVLGMHHQGIFRVSGSQNDINNYKQQFEKGVNLILIVCSSFLQKNFHLVLKSVMYLDKFISNVLVSIRLSCGLK